MKRKIYIFPRDDINIEEDEMMVDGEEDWEEGDMLIATEEGYYRKYNKEDFNIGGWPRMPHAVVADKWVMVEKGGKND